MRDSDFSLIVYHRDSPIRFPDSAWTYLVTYYVSYQGIK